MFKKTCINCDVLSLQHSCGDLWQYKRTKSVGIAEYGQLCYNYKYPPDWSFSYNSVVIIVNTSVHVHVFTKIHGEGIMSHIFHCSYVALWEGKYHTSCIGKTILGGIYFTVKQILVQTHYHMLFQKILLHVCMHICKSSCVKYYALIVCCLLERVEKGLCTSLHVLLLCTCTFLATNMHVFFFVADWSTCLTVCRFSTQECCLWQTVCHFVTGCLITRHE